MAHRLSHTKTEQIYCLRFREREKTPCFIGSPTRERLHVSGTVNELEQNERDSVTSVQFAWMDSSSGREVILEGKANGDSFGQKKTTFVVRTPLDVNDNPVTRSSVKIEANTGETWTDTSQVNFGGINYPKAQIKFGHPQHNDGKGIQFRPSQFLPDAVGVAPPEQGVYFWVQHVDLLYITHRIDNDEWIEIDIEGLDKNYPYPAAGHGNHSKDSPNTKLIYSYKVENGQVTDVDQFDNIQYYGDFVMHMWYVPPVGNATAVPLRKLDWQWHLAADYDHDGGTGFDVYHDDHSEYTWNNTPDSAANEHYEWTNVITAADQGIPIFED